MEKLKPIKRSKELAPLSREHHDGLMLVWKIRKGIRKETEPQRIGKYVQFFYRNHLIRHFEIEEQYIFSLLPPTNPVRLEAESQHTELRKMIGEISDPKLLNITCLVGFSDLLEGHIRLEERILFPLIEKEADPGLFATYGNMLANEEILGCSVYADEFWL